MKTFNRLVKNKLFVTIIILLIIGIVIFIFYRINNTNQTPKIQSFTEANKIEATQIKDNIQIVESNKIYDIGDGKPVITAIIKNTTPLLGKYPFLKRTYKDDLIITTPDQTVIYTSSTKSIRDISTVSPYEQLSKSIKR